uniref:glycosyltransferase family 2 protein n=1 Tax=Phocaeicola sp. TaxID=2773926 RepID=UPI003FF0A562
MPKVSVIIPIYKVEAFIVRCVNSLMRQTLSDIEYIFVNDATPDNSMALLQLTVNSYPERKEQVRIVAHEYNQGLPAARNSGLAVATGKYIFHCDSDDYMEDEMLEQLYLFAEGQHADIVWCDWYLSFRQKERYMSQPAYNTPLEALKGMLGGAMKYNVWNKLVRRDLYIDNHIIFPSGYGMGEDMTMMLLFAFARKVAYLPKAFYHYVKLNTVSFSHTYSDRHLKELRYNVDRMVNFLQNQYGIQFEQEIAFFKLEAKFPFLISDGSKGEYRRWTVWFPEANRYILQNRNVSMRSRCLQWCAWKRQFWMVWLYYWLVNRLIYGIIYK